MSEITFDSKHFNPQAFAYKVNTIPNVTKNELRKSKALTNNADINNLFKSQNGSAYAKFVMKGLLDGQAVNYDGQTDIEATSTKTYEQGVIVVGRAKAWTEKDFSYDITSGVDFMDNIAKQVGEYWGEQEQKLILSVLKGVFSMSGDDKSTEFVDLHTYDVTGADDGFMSSATLNSAIQTACGDNKKKFSLVFMHSVVATNLENLNLMKHLTYTDKDGLTRDLELYTWNGRLVIVDDSLPFEGDEYTTYILGDGAITFENIGAKVPYELSRDAKTNGGVDTLYTRQRYAFSPFGISYEKNSQASLSPTDDELEDGGNWCLVHSGESDESERSYINHKAIPIARIISKG